MAPRSDVSTERRTQIIQAALACFNRKGYTNTTMDDIVTESGLSKGSLYWYFKSKDDLFNEALLSVVMGFGEEIFAGMKQCPTSSGKLRALARAMVDFSNAIEIEGLFNLFIEFWAQSSHREEAGQLWMRLLEQYKDIVVDIIEEGVSAGEFKPVDAEPLVWAVLAAYDGLAVYATLVPGLDLGRVSQTFVETLLSGLEAEGG